MPFRYVPLLRTKTGEANALHHLSPQAKGRLLPVMQIVASPPANFALRMSQAWPGLPIAVDGHYNLGVTGSVVGFSHLVRDLGRHQLQVMPAIECDTAGPYLAAVQAAAGRYAPGLVVLASLRQLRNVQPWVQAQGWRRRDVDLVIKLGHLGQLDVDVIEAGVTAALRQHIGAASPWRSVTLASAAAPKDTSGLPLGRTNFPRLDWQLWNQVHGNVPFQLDYGDYATAHPDLTDPPGAAMATATISVRYTVDDDWIVLKGRPIGGARGQPMGHQYRNHAITLTRDPQFDHVAGCHGDQRIQQIAAGTSGPGNRTTWVEVAVNRHLSLVADRLP
jgi:hypothetical protein